MPTAKGLVDLSLFQFSPFLAAFTFPKALSNVMLFYAIMETSSAMLINDKIEVMAYGCIKANLKFLNLNTFSNTFLNLFPICLYSLQSEDCILLIDLC